MTIEHTLTTNWVEVGTGPVYLETSNRAVLHFADTEPAEDAAYISLGADTTQFFQYPGTKKVWARRRTRDGSKLVVVDLT